MTCWQETAALRSRRELLLTSTLALAGAATACVPLAPQRPGAANVIGTGIAGLPAVYRLAQAGVRVRLFAARTRIGGRILSLRNHFADGAGGGAGAADPGDAAQRIGMREARFLWLGPPWTLGSHPCLQQGTGPAWEALSLNPSVACASPASIVRPWPRGASVAVVKPGTTRRMRCESSWG